MKKWCSLVLALILILGMTVPASAAQTEWEYKRSLALENIAMGYDAIGKYLQAKFVGFVFDSPSSNAGHSAGTTQVGCYYEILGYHRNYGIDAYFKIQFGSKVGWVLANKVKVTDKVLVWGAWSKWSTQKPSAFSARQIEKRVVSQKRTVYKYSRFAVQCVYYDESGSFVWTDYYAAECYPNYDILSAEWEYKTSSSRITTGKWFNETISQQTTKQTTQYRYRTAKVY